ncbi:hypothetical protein ABZP36_026855 [Zizania latifolia]
MDKSSDCGGGDGRRADDVDDEMEEGEIRLVDGGGDSGSETETDDEVTRYVFQPRDKDRPENNKRRRLGDVVAEGPGALPSPTPSSGSDGTVSDGSVGVAAAAASASQGSSNAEPIPNVSTAACQQAAPLHHAPPLHAAALAQLLQLSGQARPTYRCKVEGCNKEYGTYQGLGGHMAGHINKDKQATLAVQEGDANASGRGGAKPEGTHPCKVCKREFKTGVALGGHMRKHYQGKVIIQKKKQQEEHDIAPPTAEVAPAALAPTIAAAALPSVEHDICLNLSLAPPTAEVAPAPALAPAITSATALPSVEHDIYQNLSLAPPTAEVTPAALAPAIAAAALPSVEHDISLNLSLAPPTAEVAPAALAPAITAATALPSVEPKAEVAEDGAEPAPAPSAATRILRLFGCDIVPSVLADNAEEGAKPSGEE